jgi:hypothetical protein
LPKLCFGHFADFNPTGFTPRTLEHDLQLEVHSQFRSNLEHQFFWYLSNPFDQPRFGDAAHLLELRFAVFVQVCALVWQQHLKRVHALRVGGHGYGGHECGSSVRGVVGDDDAGSGGVRLVGSCWVELNQPNLATPNQPRVIIHRPSPSALSQSFASALPSHSCDAAA